jgi:hypothetical protein
MGPISRQGNAERSPTPTGSPTSSMGLVSSTNSGLPFTRTNSVGPMAPFVLCRTTLLSLIARKGISMIPSPSLESLTGWRFLKGKCDLETHFAHLDFVSEPPQTRNKLTFVVSLLELIFKLVNTGWRPVVFRNLSLDEVGNIFQGLMRLPMWGKIKYVEPQLVGTNYGKIDTLSWS